MFVGTAWCTPDGCKRGEKCKFSHSMLNPRDNRCFGCSAVGHSKKDCPYLKKKVAKGRLTDSKVEDNPRTKREETAGDPKSREQPPNKPPSNLGDSGSQGGSEFGKGDQMESFMQEAAALMKSLQPKVKTVRLCKADSGEFRTGLLDGGATNPLRKGTAEGLKFRLSWRQEM